MECQFLSLNMRIPPPIFRAALSPLYPVPTTSLIFSNKRHILLRPLFFSVGCYSSPCAAALDVEAQKCKRIGELEEKPRKLCSSDWLESNESSCSERNAESRGERNLDRLGDGQIKNLDGKERLKWYSEMLKNCALKLNLNEGKATHGKLVKYGIEPDVHLWVSLINFYAKCRGLSFARQVLDEMPERDVVSWTALICGFVAAGYGKEGVLLFSEMQKEGIRPNEFTFATVLKAISMCLDLDIGKQVHTLIIKRGILSDIYVGSALVDLYSKCGHMEYADKVFFHMPEQNAVSWNALLNGYAEMGDAKEIFIAFSKMTRLKMKPSKYNLSVVLKGVANSGNSLAGKVVHCMAIKMGCELDEVVGSTLLDMYSKCGLANYGLKVFNRIRSPDIVAWTAMISCLYQQGQDQEAVELFLLMRDTGLIPNQYTLASLISAASYLDPQICKSIHACVYKYGFESDNVVSNALITMYMKIGSFRNGCKVFDITSNRDVISWNSLLSGFHDYDTCDEGPRFFCQMLLKGFKPNMYTFISVLRSCSHLSSVSFGKQVHAHIIKESLDQDVFIGTSLIDMYAKCKRLDDAEVIFRRLNERDLFTWTVIISGYAQTDQGEKAIQCFTQMQKEGIKPNEFTLASCLRGCSGIPSLESGRQLHSFTIKSGHLGDIFVGSSIVDMYGKCGCIADAEAFFEGLGYRDTVAWNTIIVGYSQHGQGYKSLEAFKIMLDEGVEPDEITLLGILSACSHMGLIEEGKKYFTSISEVYGIVPSIEHYACMVDILGRAGKFNEVDDFIKDMKIEPNVLIWETVLGACKIHGNLELGEKAAEKLFELEPKIDSNYILLSNIFASKGRWGDVSKVRELMSTHGVKKEPGCSWVDVNSKTHVFLSQDGSHPKVQEIYRKLDELGQKLTSVGYTPNTDYVLHDVTDKEKKENVFYHSERLALAFALISNTANKTVRIFKNLRICGDCHDFMKFTSEIVNREIVVRDIKRFHHFRNGTCSCQDYW